MSQAAHDLGAGDRPRWRKDPENGSYGDLFRLALTDCKCWVEATWKAHAMLGVALVIVTIAAYQRNTTLSWLAGLLLVAAAIYLSHVIRRARMRVDYPVNAAHFTVAAVQLIVGAVVVVWSRSRHTALGDVVGFLGLAFAIIGFGGILSEVRRSLWMQHRRGQVLLSLAFFALALSVIVLSSDHLLRNMLIAIVLGLLGIELYSEDYLRSPHDWGKRTMAAVGAALLAVAVGVFVSTGAGFAAAVVIALVILVIVSMATSDSNALLLVLVVAAALLWAGAPRDVKADAALAPVPTEPYFLVLGDSYISGEGASTFYEGTNETARNSDFTNGCRRAPTAWPNLLAKSGTPGVPHRVLFLACSGAEARHVRVDPPVDANGHQNEIDELLAYQTERAKLGLEDRKPDFVLLSLGGNDAGFGNIGQTCTGPGECAEVSSLFVEHIRGTRDDSGAVVIPSLESTLDKSYADIKTIVGQDVPVVVTGYPKPITEFGPCADVLLTDHERAFVVRFVEQLNLVVESAAHRAGFDYIETMQESFVAANNRLCEPGNPVGMNFIGLNPKAGSLWDSLQPANWVHNSLHPNKTGHAAMAVAAEKWFVKNPTRHPPVATNAAPTTVQPDSEIFGYGFIRTCDPQGDRSCDIEDGGWASDQKLSLAQSTLLPLVLAMIGAWMIAISAIGWTTEHNVNSASVAGGIFGRARDVVGRWLSLFGPAGKTKAPEFAVVTLVVANMATSLKFYRELGLALASSADALPHVEWSLPGGGRLVWETAQLADSLDPVRTAPEGGYRVELAFACETVAAVDAKYEALRAAGYEGRLPPYDVAGGTRSAVVMDPDGNFVELYASLPS
ncbi:MAG: hypothetical protein QOH79_3095 [Acidimicrobiaceae bacterium]